MEILSKTVYGPLYTKGEKLWGEKFKPMGGLKTEKTKECHFTPKFLAQRTKGRENDMDNTFVFCGSKNAHFSMNFASGPPPIL